MRGKNAQAAGKGRRAAGMSVRIAAYISALFLALLCDIAYNEWRYQRETAALAGGPPPSFTPLTAFTLLVLGVVSLSLVLIIRGAFQTSMNEKIRELGTLASVGAAPRQLRARLLKEAAGLCAIPVLLGCLTGTALGRGALRAVNALAADMAGRRAAVWHFHPLTLALALLLSGGTVLLAAGLPARKLSRISPLAAIRYAGEPSPRRAGRFFLLSRLFGVEGELAGNALRARRKALRTSTLSLTLAFLGFTLMLCFFTLSEISTDHTYFERYQGAWDVMITVSPGALETLPPMEALGKLEGAKEATAYQKAAATALVPQGELSEALEALGGPAALSAGVSRSGTDWLLSAPLTILDDQSFLAYCAQTGAARRLDGAIVLNRVWDSLHSGFRYPEYLPYLKTDVPALTLQSPGGTVRLPLLACAAQPPLLRESYENYALPVFLPLSLWKELAGKPEAEPGVTLRLLAEGAPTEAGLNALEAAALQALGPEYAPVSENRLREKRINEGVLRGYKLVLGALCGLLAVIGLANVFTFTLTFLYQRRRELARYQSLGMTPGGVKRLFLAEALAIGGRPLAIVLPLTVAAVSLMIRMSDLNPAEFWTRAPYGLVAAFGLGIFAFVGLAYGLGARRILRDDLAEALQGE